VTFKLWPRSLRGRTAVVLLAGLVLVQGAGLTIHALDRVGLQRIAQARDLGVRMMSIYRSVATASADQREAVVREFELPANFKVSLDPGPPADSLPQAVFEIRRPIIVNMQFVPLPPRFRPIETIVHGGLSLGEISVGMHLPDGDWVNIHATTPPPRPWASRTFLLAFALMTAAAAGLTLWATSRLVAPVRTLAAAAEQLGRDVNAPPLPEDGPTEVGRASAAFNTMAARIRRFVQDRTFLLTAIGHDLRTPITRLKLRAEWMEDEDQRTKMLADLDELEAMVAATLVFGQDAAGSEPVVAFDLAGLLRTILDEAGDMRPAQAERVAYEGLAHLTMRARPRALKRAFGNLVTNALNYGGSARVCLDPAENGVVTIAVEDDGPGLPPGELDRVFEPFHRLESSRNRETGGTGLGLPIARNILRAHGGDVVLANRPMGGARATVTLPA